MARGGQLKKSKTAKTMQASRSMRKVARSELRKFQETNFWDINITQVATWGGAIHSLTAVPQGTADQNRIGDKLTPVSMTFRYHVISPTSGVIRLIFFRYKLSSTPVPGDVLISTNLGTSFGVTSGYEHDLRSDFEVLHDVTLGSTAGSSSELIVRKKFKKMASSKKIEFVASGASGRNKVYLLVIGNKATSPTVVLTSRLNYIG